MPPKAAPPGPPPRAGGPRPSAGPVPRQPAGGGLDLERARGALRRVDARDVHDSSGAAAAPALDSAEAVLRYQRYVQLFNIECWLGPLGDATFPTAMAPLHPEEARALIALHEGEGEAEALEAAAASLTAVAERLQAKMDDMGAGAGCMVKTSSRSAKDHTELAGVRRRVEGLLAAFPARDENALLVALSYASMEMLCVSDARRVVDSFVRSERIWNDMHLALAHEEHWAESLVARRWVHLEPDMEFRCFVAGGRLTAASQYRHLVCFPRLLALRAQLCEGLLAFVEGTVQPRLAGVFPEDRYVADLAVELCGGSASNVLQENPPADLALGRWWCIEVNPFFETTDGCLFSWSRERDLLEGRRDGGAAPFEFRLQERRKKGGLSLVYGEWKAAVEGLLESRGDA